MNHLVPIESFLFTKQWHYSYGLALRQSILKDHKKDAYARMAVLPSFKCEYVFSLERKSNKYQIRTSIAKKQIWGNNGKGIKIENNLCECSNQFAKELTKMWSNILLQTRYIQNNYPGLDGTSYYFSAFEIGLGTIEGKTWSPDENSLIFNMTKIGKMVFSYAHYENTTEETVIELIKNTREKYNIKG